MIWGGSRDSDAGCARIRKIPRIGPIVATAIVAAVGNGLPFPGARLRCMVGSCHGSTQPEKGKLLGISKRSHVYLRKVLIHGVRAAAMLPNPDLFHIRIKSML